MSNVNVLDSSSIIEQYNDLKKEVEGKKSITGYVQASGRVWMEDFERVKLELNNVHVALACLKKRSLAMSLPSTR